MSEYLIQSGTLTAIADAIRDKTGESGQIAPEDMPDKISDIGPDGRLSAVLDGTITELTTDVETITEYALYQRAALTAVHAPNCTYAAGSAFNKCAALAVLDMPQLYSTGNYTFTGCTALTQVVLPNLWHPLNSAFSSCSNLQKADIGGTQPKTEFYSNCFKDCAALDTLIVRGAQISRLNSTSLEGTAIAAGNGYIYVPAALVDSYKQETNWTLYAEQIRAIEDHPDITGGAV